MENYIQKIISVFTASKHSEKVIEEVHQWLVDKEYSDEKRLLYIHYGVKLKVKLMRVHGLLFLMYIIR